MLSSISPLGEQARATRWGTTVTAYLLGSLIGGLGLGALAALAGGLVPAGVRSSTAVTLMVGVLLLLLALADVLSSGTSGRAPRLRLPSWQRQVDERWLGRYRGWVYGLGFGAQLGFGVVTIISSATVYAVVLVSAWSGELATGLLLGGTFGLVRALPVLTVRRVDEPASLRRLLARVERWARPAEHVAIGSLTAAGAVVVAVGAGGGVL
jgi:predicted lipid-binding transport protein (Tim44 family)